MRFGQRTATLTCARGGVKNSSQWSVARSRQVFFCRERSAASGDHMSCRRLDRPAGYRLPTTVYRLLQERPLNAERQTVNRFVGGDTHVALRAEGEADDVHSGHDEPRLRRVRRDTHDAAPRAVGSSDIEEA